MNTYINYSNNMSFQKFYDKYKKLIYKEIGKRTESIRQMCMEIEDIEHELLIRVYKIMPKYKNKNSCSISTYITYNARWILNDMIGCKAGSLMPISRAYRERFYIALKVCDDIFNITDEEYELLLKKHKLTKSRIDKIIEAVNRSHFCYGDALDNECEIGQYGIDSSMLRLDCALDLKVLICKIKKCIENFPEKYQEVFLLSYVDGLPNREVSNLTGYNKMEVTRIKRLVLSKVKKDKHVSKHYSKED